MERLKIGEVHVNYYTLEEELKKLESAVERAKANGKTLEDQLQADVEVKR